MDPAKSIRKEKGAGGCEKTSGAAAPGLLEVRQLVLRYPGLEKPAVDGVDFEIQAGEIFGLLGPNGAGKTTTISMVTGLLKPSAGQVLFEGRDLWGHPGEFKRHLGLVPQELAIYPSLSAWDNLAFYGRIYGLAGKELRERVAWALNFVGLGDRRGDPVEKYSGGMKRRLNLAAGLLHRPELLVLDEPTVGVDPQSRNFIFENIQALNREGVTILYTTHYMEEAEHLCRRVAIIDQGKIIALDTPQRLIQRVGGGILRLDLLGQEDQLLSLAEDLRALEYVRAVVLRDHHMDVETTQVQTATVAVINEANRLGCSISGLEILQPNLETVFLQLTGKLLRD
jgi:ABC-2 type transport system ATP-binding protein